MKYKVAMPDGEELFFDEKPKICIFQPSFRSNTGINIYHVTAKVNIEINGEGYEFDFNPDNEDFDDFAVDSEIVDEVVD